MLKKTIKFKDFNGVETEEDFYFNLTKAEAALLEVARDGGKTLSESLQTLIENKSNKQVMKEFVDIIRLAYGVRSLDGKRFEKGEDFEKAREFESTGAYHELLLELITDANAAVHFINGCLPEEMSMDPDKVVAESLSTKTARQISEERMQGYNKKGQSAQPTTQIVPDLPTTYAPAPAPVDVPGASPIPVSQEPAVQSAPVQGDVTYHPGYEPNRGQVNQDLAAQYAAAAAANQAAQQAQQF